MKRYLSLLLVVSAHAANPQITSWSTLVAQAGRAAWSSKNKIAYDFAETSGAKAGYFDVAVINTDGSGYTCITCPGSAGVSALPSPSLNIGNPQFTPDGNFLIFMVQANVSLGSIALDFAGFPGQGYRCDLWATDMIGDFWQLTTQARWGVAGILTAVAVTPGTDNSLPNSGTFTTTGGGGTGATGTFTASGGNLATVTLTTGGTGSGYTSNPTMVPNSGSLGTSTVQFIGSGGVIYPTMSHGGTRLTWGQRDIPGTTEIENATPGQWDLAYATFSETGGVPSIGTVTLKTSQSLGTQAGYIEPHGFSLDDSTIFFMGNITSGMNEFARNIYSYNLNTTAFVNLTNNIANWNEYPTALPSIFASTRLIYMLYPNVGGQPGQNPNCVGDYHSMNYDGTNDLQLTFFNTVGNPEYVAGGVCMDTMSFAPGGIQFVAFNNAFAAAGHTGLPGPIQVFNMVPVSSLIPTGAVLNGVVAK